MDTQLIVDSNSKHTFGAVRNGLEGNLDVVSKMIELTRNSLLYDRGFDAFVKGLIKDNGLDSHSSPTELFTFLYNFVKSHVSYILDVGGKIEHLKDARTTLSDGFGDCDDNAILHATILGVLGFKPFFVMARYDPLEENFSHIYTVVYVGGERYVFDTTLREGHLNKEEKPVAIKEIGVFDYDAKLDGVRGVFHSATRTGKELAKTALQATPELLSFVPFGYIASTAFKAGADFLLESDAFGNAVYDKTQYDNVTAINRQFDSIIRKLYDGTITIEQAHQYADTQMLRFKDLVMKSEINDSASTNLRHKYSMIMNFQSVAEAQGLATFNLDGQRILVVGIFLIGTVSVLYLMNK